MNQVILMGRLTRDPEIRYSQGENSIAITRFSLAVDRKSYNGDQEADFISCVAFRKSAEFIEKYFRQGMRVLISGRIQTGNYINKDGKKVYSTNVVVETHEFADSKKSGAYQESGVGDAGFVHPDQLDEEIPFN